MKSYALNILSIFSQNILPSQIYLAIGAGIWEEFLFRVIILGVSINFMKYILGFNYLFSAFISIAISGIIFSLFHYIGQLGDIFTFRVFSFRAFAGLILGTLYLMRGFAIITQPQIININ
jgi:membrane protease YdiL (CAAX protease family)